MKIEVREVKSYGKGTCGVLLVAEDGGKPVTQVFADRMILGGGMVGRWEVTEVLEGGHAPGSGTVVEPAEVERRFPGLRNAGTVQGMQKALAEGLEKETGKKVEMEEMDRDKFHRVATSEEMGVYHGTMNLG